MNTNGSNDTDRSADRSAAGRDERLQAEAERAERLGLASGANAAVDRYRLVMRALRQPLPAQLPADFAVRLARRIVQPEERGSIEDWLVSIVLFGVGVAGLFYLQPVMASVLESVHFTLPRVPWSLLVAVGIAIGVAWAVDRGAAQFKRTHVH
jgi:hypothetical protein